MGVFCARSADAPLDPTWSVTAPTRAYISLVRLSAALAFGVAVLIMLGWAWDVTLFKSGVPGERATQPLSAVCFALCAISLALSTERCVLCRFFRHGCALAVLFVVIATVWQNALDIDWGLDRLLFADAVVHEQTGPFLRPGRPAAGTLVALGLLCFCLLLTDARSAAGRTSYVWLTTIGALLAATLLLAYAFSLQAVYALGFYAHVGCNSGAELAILAYGALLRRPDLGWMRLVAGNSPGALDAQRTLQWTGILLVVLTVIVRVGTSAKLHSAGFAVLLLTVAGVGLLLVLLLAHARRLNALDTIPNNPDERQLALLAHELRNPLTPLRNGIEIVRQMSSANPALARVADMMARQIVQLVQSVDKLVEADPAAAPRDSRAAKDALLGTSSESNQPRLRILVADDNADGADSLAMLLQAEGHVVLTAPDGRRAIEVAEGFRPDVILMDVAMPNVDGLEATREIRQRPWGQSTRIIALTAWGQEAERRRTKEAGVNAHLVKPVDPQALQVILRADT